MLRINLLPPYIYEGSARKKVMVLWVVIVLAVVGGFLAWKMSLDKQVEKINSDTAEITQKATDADNMQSQANDIASKSQAIRAKADFINEATDYNLQTYPNLLNNVIARYTLRGVLYDAMVPQAGGQVIQLPAYAPDLATVGHYMMAMERNPGISNVSVQMSSLPVFPGGTLAGSQPTGARPESGAGHNFTVTLTLAKPIPPGPAYPKGAAPAAAAGGAGGGMGGPPPGIGGPPPGIGGPPMMSGGGMGAMGGRPMMGRPMGPGGGMGGPPPGIGGPPMMSGGGMSGGAPSGRGGKAGAGTESE